MLHNAQERDVSFYSEYRDATAQCRAAGRADVATCRSVSSASPPLAYIWSVGPTAAVAGRRSLAIVWNATVYHGDILQPLWPQLLSAPPPQLVLPRDCPGVRLGQCV